MEVTDFGLVAQRSLVQALGGCSLVLAPKEVSGSGLLWQRLLVRAWSCGYPWLWPGPMKVTGLGLLLWKSLAWTWFPQRLLFRPASLEVSP